MTLKAYANADVLLLPGRFAASGLANGKLASIEIDELIAGSDAIVIARVSRITTAKVPAHPSRSGNVVYADAIAQRTLKGSVGHGRMPLRNMDATLYVSPTSLIMLP